MAHLKIFKPLNKEHIITKLSLKFELRAQLSALVFVSRILWLHHKRFCEMPLTDAERQRLYRERLKQNHPEKYLLQKLKDAERTRLKRKKISEYSPSEQENIRKQWRERKNKGKEIKVKVEKSKQTRNQGSVNYKLRKENKDLKLRQEILKNSLKNFTKQLKRRDDRINELLQLIKKKDKEISELQASCTSNPTIIIVQKNDEEIVGF